MSKDFKLDPIVADELKHYGVKGMKWGVRKDRTSRQPLTQRERYKKIRSTTRTREVEVTTKNGVSVKAIERPPGRIPAFLWSLSKTGVEDAANSSGFDIEVGGKNIGFASFNKKSSDEINLVWLNVKPKERGKGYASAIFDAAVEYGKTEGVSKLTLEVPGNAPDARHIYEKRGFKVTKEPTAEEIREDYLWNGLTHMELDLTDERLRHSNLSEDEELELAFEQTFPQLTESQEELLFGNSDDIVHSSGQELFHYGVKGMKWGVRKDRGGGSSRRRSRFQPAGADSGARPKKMSRKQRRQEAQRAQQKAYQKRAAEAFDHAANNPDSLVKVRTEYGPYILTGQQFVAYVYGGGAFDVRTVEVVEPVEKERGQRRRRSNDQRF